MAAASQDHRVLFATATQWVTRLTEAHRTGRLPQELARLRRYGLINVDEVGYLPFEPELEWYLTIPNPMTTSDDP